MTGPDVIELDTAAPLAPALAAAGIAVGHPVLVVVGGAAQMTADTAPPLTGLLTEHLVPLLDQWGVTVVDGGTDAGVMRLMGDARARAHGSFPLVGVAAEGTVALTSPPIDDQAVPEPGHTHLVLVPGTEWGDESPWLSAVAEAIAAGRASLTLLINGGSLTLTDALHSLTANRPLLVLAGTGRSADDIAHARADPAAGSAPTTTIAASALTRIISIDDPAAVAAAIEAHLRTG